MKINIVVAYSLNRVIGNKNTIPWRIRDDLKHLKQLTQGKIVIVGRNTFDSMHHYYQKSGRQMPGACYIIVTSRLDLDPQDSIRTVSSIEKALHEAAVLKAHEVYVIGGAQIYKMFLPKTDTIYATEIKTTIDGDAVFPEIGTAQFREISRENFSKDTDNEYDFSFITYQRM